MSKQTFSEVLKEVQADLTKRKIEEFAKKKMYIIQALSEDRLSDDVSLRILIDIITEYEAS